MQQAANDCAMSAAQTISAAQGFTQGVTAAKASFNTFNLSGNADISMRGSWERGGRVTCSVTYTVPFGNFPMKVAIQLPDQVSHEVTLPVQYYKSDWVGH